MVKLTVLFALAFLAAGATPQNEVTGGSGNIFIPMQFPCNLDDDCPPIPENATYGCDGVFVVRNGTYAVCVDGECGITNKSTRTAECLPGRFCIPGQPRCRAINATPTPSAAFAPFGETPPSNATCSLDADCTIPTLSMRYCRDNDVMLNLTHAACIPVDEDRPSCHNMTCILTVKTCAQSEYCNNGTCTEKLGILAVTGFASGRIPQADALIRSGFRYFMRLLSLVAGYPVWARVSQ